MVGKAVSISLSLPLAHLPDQASPSYTQAQAAVLCWTQGAGQSLSSRSYSLKGSRAQNQAVESSLFQGYE